MYQKTKHEGLYFRLNKLKQKVFVARYKINGKEYKKVIGKEPQYNLITAFKARQDLIDSHYSVKQPATLKEAFTAYIDTFSNIRNPRWKMNRLGDFNNFESIHYKKPSEVTRGDIQRCVFDMLKRVKPSTVANIVATLKAFYRQYNRMYDTTINPCEVEIPYHDSNRELCLTIEQMQHFTKAIMNCPDNEFRLFMKFIISGRRRRETMLLCYEDINMNEMYYTVKSSNSKTKRTYKYPLTQMIADELQMSTGRIFKYSERQIENRFKILKQEAGIANMDFRMHDVRHIIGTVGVNNGLSLEQIGKALGHTSVNTTKRYSNVRLKQASAVVENVLNTIS